MKTLEVLQACSVEQLKSFILRGKINWGQVSKYKNKENFPLFSLLAAYHGDTTGEKAYRALHGNTYCKCGNITPFYNWQRGLAKFCSRKCASKFVEWEQITKKSMATSIERHGGIGMASQKIRNKIERTNLEKYGTLTPAANKAVRDKIKSTMVDRYGTDVPYKNKEIASAGGATKKFNTWKTAIAELSEEYQYIDDRPLAAIGERRWQHLSCGACFMHDWSKRQRGPVCRICFPMLRGQSKFEEEIFDCISEEEIEKNKRFYFEKQYYELDLFLPKHKLGIECNGLYWHSENAGKDREYHLRKMQFFKDMGIRVLFIFEHEWAKKKDVCTSIINHCLGKTATKIAARKCDLREVSSDEAKAFIERNHVGGYAKSQHNIGLFYNNELVSLATFRRCRFGKKDGYELIRFCSKLNFVVIGALSKLVSVFQNLKMANVFSYCDLRWATGEGYLRAGFSLVKQTLPGYWYFDDDGVYHRSIFQKKKLQQITGQQGTEKQLAKIAGLNKFWDCGHLLFEKRYEHPTNNI